MTAVASSGASRRTNSVTSARLRACSTSPRSLQRSRYPSVARTGAPTNGRAGQRSGDLGHAALDPRRDVEHAALRDEPRAHAARRGRDARRRVGATSSSASAGSPGTNRSIASTAADVAMLAAPSPRSRRPAQEPGEADGGRLGPGPRDHGAGSAAGPSSGARRPLVHGGSLLLVGQSRPARVTPCGDTDQPTDAAPADRFGELPPVSSPGDGAPRARAAPRERSRSVAASRTAAPPRRLRLRSAPPSAPRTSRPPIRANPDTARRCPRSARPRAAATSAAVRTLTHDDAELPGVHAHARAEPAEAVEPVAGCSRSSMRSADSCWLAAGPVVLAGRTPRSRARAAAGSSPRSVPSLLSRYASDCTMRGVDAERHVVDEHPSGAPRRRRRGARSRRRTRRARRRRRRDRRRGRARGGCGSPRACRRTAGRARSRSTTTSACEPSPPAMPITSAPSATASRASCSRSSPGPSTTGFDAPLASPPRPG